ncbi:MAG: hypothetical protein ABSC71_17780 [Candidatus Acidiferrales bacterium]|jgi:uncharacterized membrane protein YphA (DoxX/SURF4 family)
MQTPLMMLTADLMHRLLQLFSALAFAAIFGIPREVFWPYFLAISVFLIGVVIIVRTELPGARGLDRVYPFGRVLYCVPIAGFAGEHFVFTQDMTKMIPDYLPFHRFWVIFCGICLLAAALAIVTKVMDRLASLLLGLEFLGFVLLLSVPFVFQDPHNRISWALTLRDGSFSAAALAYSGYLRRPATGQMHWLTIYGRIFIGITTFVYGFMQILHPANVPAVPLERFTPDYIPLHAYSAYLGGVIFVIAGACLLANFRAREAATVLGLTTMFYMLVVYTPILLATPGNIADGFNYFFDTLMFAGALLMLAGSLPKAQTQFQTQSESKALNKEGHAHA